MLPCAHLLALAQASPPVSACLSFPSPLLSTAAFLVQNQRTREHGKHKERVLKQQGCGRNYKIPAISPSVLGQVLTNTSRWWEPSREAAEARFGVSAGPVPALPEVLLPVKARSRTTITDETQQAAVLLWGMEEDVTLHLHSLEMPLCSGSFPSLPWGPGSKLL